MAANQIRVTTRDSFINGTLIPAGFPVVLPEGLKPGKNLVEPSVENMPGGVVAVAPIGPTGPNPRFPSQVPPDVVQTLAGHQLHGGVTLVSEITLPAEERRAQLEGAGGPSLADLMSERDNDGDEGPSGREIIAGLGGLNDEQLVQAKVAEEGREKPRKTVVKAIDAEQAKRLQD